MDMPTFEKKSRCFLGCLALCILVTPLLGCGGAVDSNVTTQHNDNLRTGAYLAETTLTPDNVLQRGMSEKFWVLSCQMPDHMPNGCLDGIMVTQPLYMHKVAFEKGTTSGVFVATLSNKVYGLNAKTGDCEWESYLVNGEAHVLKDETGGCEWRDDFQDSVPRNCSGPRGVNSTPVIDAPHNRMYVLYSTMWQKTADKDCTIVPGPAYWLAKLDITNGNPEKVIPVSASFQRTGGSELEFEARNQLDRPGLLLERGSIYIAFGADGNLEVNHDYLYHGWVMRYSATDLSLQSVFCTSPDATPEDRAIHGNSGIWQGGGGLAADPQDQDGKVYFLTGNGHTQFPDPAKLDSPSNFGRTFYGDSFVQLMPFKNALIPTAYTPDEKDQLDSKDADLGSGGAMLIPGSNLVIGGGKTGIMYLLDRNSMKLQQQFPASTNQYHPWLRGQSWKDGPHLHGSPTYWQGADSAHGNLYVWGEKDFLKLFKYNNVDRTIEANQNAILVYPEVPSYRQGPVRALPDTMPGGMLSVSANGNNKNTGIVWATLPRASHPTWPDAPGQLYAFDGETLEFLWDTPLGTLAHWVAPTIADATVFIATSTEGLVAYELGPEDGSKRSKGKPYQPFSRCEDCHDFRNRVQAPMSMVQPLHNNFPNEAAARASTALAWRQVAPPQEEVTSLVLEGEGLEIYEAKEDTAARGKFMWNLKESTADLVVVRSARANQKTPKETVHVQLSQGSTWSASDGSIIVGEIQKTAPAPESADASWVRFKVVKSSGQGILSRQNYILRVHTHAGKVPAIPPKGRGEVARVPNFAQYWLYAERPPSPKATR
jgi:outer membrane protein assembly factor BamB